MTTKTTIPQDSIFDKLNFITRSWLNWLAILAGLIRENWRRWPTTWLVDVLATALVTLLLVPAWGIYRLAAMLTIVLVVATTRGRHWGAQALRDLVTIAGLVALAILAGLWLLANKLEP